MSHSPWSENLRARKRSGVSQAGSNCLRTRRAESWSESESPEPETLMSEGRGDGCLSSTREGKFILPLPCILLKISTDCVMLSCTGEGHWSYCLLIQMLLSPRDTFTDTPRNRNDVLPAVQAYFSPVMLTYSHHRIIWD